MITTEQMAAAQDFLASCEPANALVMRQSTMSRPDWSSQLRSARAARSAARTTVIDLCGTRDVYQAAIAAAREKRRVG